MLEELFEKIDDERLVYFTGKLNLLNEETKQFIAQIYFIDGELVNVNYQGITGRKGFFNLCVDLDQPVDYVSEPELVSLEMKKIHISFEDLKKEFEKVSEKYKQAKKHQPPKNVKILINSDFVLGDSEVESDEFDLLCCLSDFNTVTDIYKNCDLLDYQITNSLVTLRKKKALKVVKIK